MTGTLLNTATIIVGASLGVALGGRLSERVRGSITDVLGLFVVATLIVCVGPLAILGALQDGLTGSYQLLAVKAVLDGTVSVAFASVLEIGAAFAAIALLLWQGGLTLAASAVGSDVTDPMIAALTAVGGFLIVGIGLRLLEVRSIRVANLLPALLIAPAVVAFWP